MRVLTLRSDLQGHRLRLVALPRLADGSSVDQRDGSGPPVVTRYRRARRLVRGVTLDLTSRLAAQRTRLQQRLDRVTLRRVTPPVVLGLTMPPRGSGRATSALSPPR